MKLGIDLHNVRDGGGVSYTTNLLAAFDPQRHGFEQIHVFGAEAVLARLPDRPCIVKHSHPLLARSLPHRLRFLFFHLTDQLRAHGCSMLYSPGGLYFGGFRPFATISRNMMPYETQHWAMYPLLSFDRLRLVLLRWLHTATFRRADGMVFLTEIARRIVGAAMGPDGCSRRAVIAHGVNRRLFSREGRAPLPEAVSPDDAITLVYPSRLEPYKHQVEVVEAMALLRREFPRLSIDLCGQANAGYLPLVQAAIARVDPQGAFIRYRGEVPLARLPDFHEQSQLMVFASSCENLPNTMLEAMAFGVPIVSANRPPMPDLARGACLYFDPQNAASIADSIRQALLDWPATRARMQAGLALAQAYSWDRCADQTFAFLRSCHAARNESPSPAET